MLTPNGPKLPFYCSTVHRFRHTTRFNVHDLDVNLKGHLRLNARQHGIDILQCAQIELVCSMMYRFETQAGICV